MTMSTPGHTASAPAPDGLPSIGMIEPTGGYVAGACNIGPAEIARRRRSGWIGVAASLAVAVVLVLLGTPAWTRLGVALPLYIAAIGFIQARDRFCVGFAAAGVTNFERLGTVHRIEDEAARTADRRHARGLLVRAAAIALVGAVFFALVPV
jgi:hypothetical protein